MLKYVKICMEYELFIIMFSGQISCYMCKNVVYYSKINNEVTRRNRVNVQIVHDQHDFFTVAVVDIHQFT